MKKIQKIGGCLFAFMFLSGSSLSAVPKENVEVCAEVVNEELKKINAEDCLSIEDWRSISERKIYDNFSLQECEALLNEELETNKVDVVFEMTELIEDYQNILLNTDVDAEREKLRVLITTTQRLFSDYLRYQEMRSAGIVELNDDLGIETLKAEILTVLNSLGYKLSAELITVFFDNKNPDYIYSQPIYGTRVISSNVTKEIAESNNISGDRTFEKTGGRNEMDLYYSIHNFSYTKSSASNKIIHIDDKYDFGKYNEDTNQWEYEEYGLFNTFINILVDLENTGDLIPYDLRIEIDMREPLGIDIVGETGAIGGAGTWEVDITNNGDEAIELIYNEKMCFEDNARIWSSLTDIVIPSTKIPAGGTKRVTIQKNAAATHMAFSYIKGSTRYVTFADEIGLNKSISTELTTNYVYKYGQVEIRGKHGTIWMLRIFNNFGYTRTVEYNAKMCFESDAKNWENLNDVKRFSLAAGTYRDISIEENYFADYIALRFLGGQIGMQIYAKDLDPKGTMSLVRGNFVIYTYLTISNAGKSGSSWKINIKNPFSESITVYYNAKMCFDDDAKKWTGLNDVKSVTIGANQTKQVNISENFFATAVAFSYINSGERLITYANSLTTSGGIKVMNSVV